MLRIADLQQIVSRFPPPVLSLYLNVSLGEAFNQAATPGWRVQAKNLLRELEASVGDHQRALWHDVRRRADVYLEDYIPRSRGLALFVREDALEAHALAQPVEAHAAFGDVLIAPLYWQMDEYEHYVVALVDQQDARLLTAWLGMASEADHVRVDLDEYDFGDKSALPSAGGRAQASNREAYNAMLSEHRARFYRDVAEHIATLAGQSGAARIVLGGSDAVHDMRAHLPEALAKRVIGVLPIPLRATPHEISEAIRPAAYASERAFETTLLQEVIDLAKAGGRAVLGRKAVLEALNAQRVETLIVPWPLAEPALQHPLAALALRSNAALEMVHGEAAALLNAEGGMAARLYFRP